MLNDKVIIVTGGAGLLGQEFVKCIVENNGVAIISDINEEKGLKVKEDIIQRLCTKKVEFLKLDITSKDSIVSMINYLQSKYGKVDALVNTAYPKNKNFGKKFEETTYEDFCENVNMHLGGYFLTSQQLALYFKKQRYGNIINIASIYGVIAPRFEIYEGTNMTNSIEYAAIKSAIIHITHYIAKYFKGCNIRVNCISPGGIFVNQDKKFLNKYNNYCLSKGMLDKIDLKGTLLYLLSDHSLYLNGQNIIVDDGFTL